MIKLRNMNVVSMVIAIFAVQFGSKADAKPGESALLTLGEQTYSLDFVLCYQEPDSSVRIELGDVEARAGYPSISVWLRDSDPRSVKPQIFSINFYRTKPRLLWRFENGDYEKTASGFVASGYVNGTVLDKTAERFMTPLSEDKNQKFDLKVTCNDY